MKITAQQYSQTLLELTDGKTEQEVSGIVKKFAELLKNDGQLKNSKKIIEKFSDLYNNAHGIVEADVFTRDEMGDKELRKIEDYIKQKYSAKKVEIKNIVDEKIKGGIIIKVRDEIMDASILNQLKRLGKQMVS